MPRRFDGMPHHERQAAEYTPNRCESDDGMGWIFTHFPEGAPLRDAKIGMCRACCDVTVLPAFANGCCLGCMSNGLADEDPTTEPRHIFYEPDAADPIAEIFDEAQRIVPAFRVVVGMLGPNGSMQVRHGPGGSMESRRAARWRRWDVVPASERAAGGLSRRHAVNAYYKDLREAHAAAGLCIHCMTPALLGRSMCERHMAPVKQRYLAWKARDACLGCGGARDSDKGTCSACVARLMKAQSIRAARLLADGLCTACGREPAAPRWCATCMGKRNAARREKRRAEGPLQTPEERAQSARNAARARWAKQREARREQA